MGKHSQLSGDYENCESFPSKILPYMVSALLKLKYIIGINEDLTDVLDSLITL